MNNKWFLSSTDSGDLSLTLKSMILAFAPLLIMLGHTYGFDITQTGIEEFAAQILVILSGLGFVWGVLRKIFVRFGWM